MTNKPETLFHQQLRLWRLLTGLSQTEAARRLHVPIGTFRDWDQGRHIPHAMALKWTRAVMRRDFWRLRKKVPADLQVVAMLHLGYLPKEDKLPWDLHYMTED